MSLIVAIGSALALAFAAWAISPVSRVAEAKQPQCDVEWLSDGMGGSAPVRIYNPLNPCPGPPASVTIVTPFNDTPCASVEAITILVVDKMDYDVDDATPVSVTSTLGTVLSGATYGGRFVASLIMPPRVTGQVEIRAVVGGISAQKTLQVICG